jgi:hypothetical protein
LFKKDFFAYAQQRTFGKMDCYARIAEVNKFLYEVFGKPARQQLIEERRGSCAELIRMIDLVLRRNREKSTIVVYSWIDIANEKVINGFIEGSFAVIVLDRLFNKIGNDNPCDQDLFHINRENTSIDNGVLLTHTLDMHTRMRQYLEGKKASSDIPSNKARADSAKEESLVIWGHMKEVARNKGITSQQGIEEELHRMGIKSPDGQRIGQHYISRCLERAEKRNQWRTLKNEIKAQSKLELCK